MGNFLHKLGVFAYDHPWRIVISWIAILGLLGFAASQFIQPTSSSISIPGTPAQQAIDRTAELFPGLGGGSGRIIFHAKETATIQSSRLEIETVLRDVAQVKGVKQIISPFVANMFISQAGDIAYAQVQLDAQTGSIDEATTADIKTIAENVNDGKLQVEVGGDIVQKNPGEILGIGEVAGVAVALMVLVITLGSLIAGGMPILSAITAVGVSMAGLFALSKVIDINATTPVLAVMLGLAVGIDYALFIVNKYRSLLLSGYTQTDAAGRALGTAGNAVVFAAITVVIALSALSIVNIPFMTTMGLTGAASIAVSAVVALTLIPALLGIAGDRILRKKTRLAMLRTQTKTKKATLVVNTKSFWYKWGKVITDRPIPMLIAATIVIGVVALPVRSLDLGLPTDQYASKDSTERRAYDLLSEGFGKGFNGPLIVLAEGLPAVTKTDTDMTRMLLLRQYSDQASSLTVQQTQAGAAKLEQTVAQYAKLSQLKKVADRIASLPNVQQVTPASATDNGTAGIIQVIPKSSPSSNETSELIEMLRSEKTISKVSSSSKVTMAVTGSAALQDDINDKLSKALPIYLAVVVGLSLILLIVAFRSILVPLKATLGFLLSVLAMFGAMVAVFQWGWFGITDAPGPIVSFIPIIAIGILFGLAMDYEFFLVSSMHESYQTTKDAKKAVVNGFGAGAKVVTAAAIIMISVFAGFITNDQAVIQSIGFGLAVGIFVDAFIVRMTIVPAVMMLLGKSAWWLPKWLDKNLPHVSIEGEIDKK